VMAGPSLTTYPVPVEHCHICKWWLACYDRRKEDDHLSLVAGIRNLHISELEKQKIDTLEKFARAATIEKTERGNVEARLPSGRKCTGFASFTRTR
jgi:predicted RecB family nuclease